MSGEIICADRQSVIMHVEEFLIGFIRNCCSSFKNLMAAVPLTRMDEPRAAVFYLSDRKVELSKGQSRSARERTRYEHC